MWWPGILYFCSLHPISKEITVLHSNTQSICHYSVGLCFCGEKNWPWSFVIDRHLNWLATRWVKLPLLIKTGAHNIYHNYVCQGQRSMRLCMLQTITWQPKQPVKACTPIFCLQFLFAIINIFHVIMSIPYEGVVLVFLQITGVNLVHSPLSYFCSESLIHNTH